MGSLGFGMGAGRGAHRVASRRWMAAGPVRLQILW